MMPRETRPTDLRPRMDPTSRARKGQRAWRENHTPAECREQLAKGGRKKNPTYDELKLRELLKEGSALLNRRSNSNQGEGHAALPHQSSTGESTANKSRATG